MIKKLFFLAMLSVSPLLAAEVKDVSFACGKKTCDVSFQFGSAQNLPAYFQKFDSQSGKWTVAFAASDFQLGNGDYQLDNESPLLKSVRVFQESGKQGMLLKFEWTVGESIAGADNPSSLSGSKFTISFPKTKAKSWKISSVVAAQKKAVDLEAKRLAAEEKKAAAAEAKRKAEEERKAAKENARLAAEEKKAAAAEAKRKAEEERKAAKENARLAKEEAKAAAAEAKRKAEEEREAAKENARLAKEEAKNGTSKASSDSSVSAILEGVSEMTAIVGLGSDQFELRLLVPIQMEQVNFQEKKSSVLISVAGPSTSPVFKVNAASLVKSVVWGAEGLQINLRKGVRPVLLVHEGALIIQSREEIPTQGFSFWKASPTGIQMRRWIRPEENAPQNLEAFVAKYEKDSKKVISSSQTFFLTSVARELIVTADETEFFEAANERSTVLSRLEFGDKLESIDIVGLFHKVQSGTRVGFVDKRAVSFRDELSALQTERLKQLALAKGEMPEESSERLLTLGDDDRVMYSSFGRRDPFVDVKGLVEEGINIDQVELVGIIWESEKPMAILSDVKNSSVSYTIKEGDKVLNGKVLKITQTDVLFLIQEFGVSRRYSMGLPDKFGGQK